MSSKKAASVDLKRQRAAHANALLVAVASCGRRFFRKGDAVSRFDIAASGHVYFWDKYTCRQIATWTPAGSRAWLRYFSEGGTLKALVRAIARDYIVNAVPIDAHHFGPWPDWYSAGNPWAYGTENMDAVRAKALDLGIVQAPPDRAQSALTATVDTVEESGEVEG